jgi:glyoxylase-like metal-dependent hydrolase (beta-lactamase superfamily II)
MRFFERGWLSSNNVLLMGDDETVLIDSGYTTHSAQTLSLVQHALGERPLNRLLNTHLHSDHCGGNSVLQAAWPAMQTLIPPGLADAVRSWNTVDLTYEPTGQTCPRFRVDGVLVPGSSHHLAGRTWTVHAAPGHDPHSVILFEPSSRVLLSADALWEHGFGVVFPEIVGESGFKEIGETLSLIESLEPAVIVPGHGAVFTDLASALVRARERLAVFQQQPVKHASHAAKVLLKFKLLELQRIRLADFTQWSADSAYLRNLHESHFAQEEFAAWIDRLLDDLVRAKVMQRMGPELINL